MTLTKAALTPADWFRFAAANAAEIRLLSPRVQYVAPPGVKQSSNSHDCVAMVFRHGPVRGATAS